MNSFDFTWESDSYSLLLLDGRALITLSVNAFFWVKAMTSSLVKDRGGRDFVTLAVAENTIFPEFLPFVCYWHEKKKAYFSFYF